MPKSRHAFAGSVVVIDTGSKLTREMYDALNRRGSRGRGRASSGAADATAELLRQIHYAGLPAPVQEWKFHPTRKFSIDLAWPDLKVAVEIEGLVYSNRGDNQLSGRHVSVTGFKRDLAKYNELAILGYRLIRVTSADARQGSALTWIERAIAAAREGD